MLRDELTQKTFAQTIKPAVYAGNGTTTNGTAFDGANCNAVEHHVSVGVSGDSLSGSIFTTLVLEHSDASGSGYTAVDSADFVVLGGDAETFNTNTGAFGVVDNTGGIDSIFAIAYRGSKRYTRVNLVRTGNNANGTAFSCTSIAIKRKQPA
jgi:hypothetical protein